MDWKEISLGDLAGLISEELKKHGIDTVLVGGACVTIYSHNRYQSYDLDFITYENMKKVKEVLEKLGLIEKEGYFQHKNCKWFVEFVSPPIAVGNESLSEFEEIETHFGKVKLLRPTDCVKDRLASFYHWNDTQGLKQAIEVALEQTVDMEEIKNWSTREGHKKKYELFYQSFQQRSKEKPN
ncbi:MAG: hypothetical protein HYZ47_04200 [Simkania negevensis]|nr:hypothetical protein [Simkania negevensis]